MFLKFNRFKLVLISTFLLITTSVFSSEKNITYMQILQKPNDLDLNLKYAQQQGKMGNYKQTISTLERLTMIYPENIEITNENIVITLSQQNKNNAEKKINDCLNYYKKVYENLNINCDLVVKESVALNSSCVHKSGVFVKEETQEYIKITTYSNC